MVIVKVMTSLLPCNVSQVSINNHASAKKCRFAFSACKEGNMRLVNGSNYNEGKVEVCVDGEWGTVCNNNQALPGVVCEKLGFYADGIDLKRLIFYIIFNNLHAGATFTSSFGTESLPDNICTLQNGGKLSCMPRANTVCSEELGVECSRLNCNGHCTLQENLQCSCTPATPPTSLSSTIPTLLQNIFPPTSECVNSSKSTNEVTASTMTNFILGILTGLLAILLIMTTIALVITCAALKQKR